MLSINEGRGVPDKKSKKVLDGCERDGASGIRRQRGDIRRQDAQRLPMAAILAQLDRMPDRTDPFDPLVWDARGLPI